MVKLLKCKLNELVIPPNASLFTYNVVSMYTNIEIDDCFERISTFFSTIWDRVECAAVTSVMEIVMRNNRMRFICEVAMGMWSAPRIANLYVAIYEATYILPLLTSFLFFLKRFIDNSLGIWLHDPDPDVDAANWILFKTLINVRGLRWMSTKLSKKVIFTDITIEVSGSQLVISYSTICQTNGAVPIHPANILPSNWSPYRSRVHPSSPNLPALLKKSIHQFGTYHILPPSPGPRIQVG